MLRTFLLQLLLVGIHTSSMYPTLILSVSSRASFRTILFPSPLQSTLLHSDAPSSFVILENLSALPWRLRGGGRRGQPVKSYKEDSTQDGAPSWDEGDKKAAPKEKAKAKGKAEGKGKGQGGKREAEDDSVKPPPPKRVAAAKGGKKAAAAAAAAAAAGGGGTQGEAAKVE
eukprot:485664-Rhodomonas_salina.1